MANKRIIEFEADNSYENDDWLAIDGATNGTRKIQFKDIFDKDTVFDDLAEEYNPLHTYNTFDFCIHEDEFRKCKEDNVTGAWNSAKWDNVSVGEILKSQQSLANLNDDSTHRLVTDTEKSTWNGKQDALTFDDVPTEDSDNPVKSGGIYDAIDQAGKVQDVKVDGTSVVDANRIAQINGKADTNGKYEDLFAGNLVTDEGETDNKPYLYRQSPSDSSYVDLSLVGGTIAWNQLAHSTRTTTTISDVGFTKNADGSYTLNGTASAEIRFYIEDTSTVTTKSIGGHKVYVRGCPSGGSLNTYFVAYMNGADGLMDYSYSADVGNGKVSECHSSGFQNVGIIIKSGTQINNLTFKPNFIDLTQAFGSTIAPF